MALVTTLAQAKAYVRLPSTNEEDSLPNMDKAGRRWLVPILGQTLYDQLNDHVNEEDGPEVDADLLERCRAALVPLAYWMELGWNVAAITDAGVRQQVSENMPSAFRWQYMELKDTLHNEGAQALNDLWVFLYANADFNSWEEPDPVQVFFKDATEFCKYYPIDQAARVFQQLKPTMAHVEEHFISGAIGRDFLLELRELSPLDSNQRRALELLKRSIAHLTVAKAVEMLPCRMGPQGFTVLLGSATDHAEGTHKPAPDTQMSMVHTSATNAGQRYLAQLNDFLNSVADADNFGTYFASDYYTEPDDDTTNFDYNESRTGVFGL